MWKNLPFKKQLIIILLIPIIGLIYFTIANLNSTYKNYIRLEHSLENLQVIASLSNTKTLVNDERALYEYSKINPSQITSYKKKLNQLKWRLSITPFKDPIIKKNLRLAQDIFNEISSKRTEKLIPLAEIYKNYSTINSILDNLIEREIINCDDTEIAKLANNLKCYIGSKAATNLIRGIILDKITHDKTNTDLVIYYDNAKNINFNSDFKLTILNSEHVNDEIIKYKNSVQFKSFLSTAEEIMTSKLDLSPAAWWKTSTGTNEKLKELRNNKVNSIIKYAQEQQKTILINTVIIVISLISLLLFTIVLVYNLIRNTATALQVISNSIQKIALGNINRHSTLSGNTEFNAINSSLQSLTTGIKKQIDLSTKISSGILGETIELRSKSDLLNRSLNKMSIDLQRYNVEEKENDQLKKNIIEINKIIIDSKTIKEFGSNLCEALINQTNSCQASFYMTDYLEKQDRLLKVGTYAGNSDTPEIIKIGEGLIGEAAKSNKQKYFSDLDYTYSSISSSLGASAIYNILITPIAYKNKVMAVIELGSLHHFTNADQLLLATLQETIGSALEVFIRNEELKASVEEINRKNSILVVQEEELRQNNEELNKNAQLLQQSEEELKNQAAELEQTNAYLEEKGRELENKNHEIEKKNSDLIIAQEELNIKSDEIAKASSYKSEFLANMSHELRTPLNSILILSDLLKDNTAGNLSTAQIENLSVINSSGKDLLNLITDILDISKIEAGKVEIYPEETVVERIFSDMDSLFRVQMQKKNITFTTKITDDCPKALFTDIGKIEQVLKNFLSNAMKFTPNSGTVSMTFGQPDQDYQFTSSTLATLPTNAILAITIKDSGIGISEENKKKLFQSFQQADSSTSRKYGGTGLGLYISKQLAYLMGGEVFFDSILNQGSTFGVLIPARYPTTTSEHTEIVLPQKMEERTIESENPNPNDEFVDLSADIADDRNKADIDDKTILIIEDDPSFAEVLLQVAHNNGFKAIIAHQGETGFQYAKKYKPKAIILDMKLPGIDGWTVLKWLKDDKDLQHIPVHVMSGMKREKLAKEMGAFDFLVKPITPEKLKAAFESIDNQINKVFKKILVLEDDQKLNYSIKQLLHSNDSNVICLQAYSRQEAENILKNDDIDCAIVDLGLPDSDNIKSVSQLKSISKNRNIKIIINTGKSLSEQEQLELEKSVNSIIIKTNNATERLKDELLLFLNKIETTTETSYVAAPNLAGGEVLKDKNILIVDDDIRNIYALSAALTGKGANITTAFNGIEALEALENNGNTDIVLMDIMMPEMDGFEATRKIRENIRWKNLPIIALTAKAMKGDRDEIINAGASDYQSKPIDIQKLISLISIWIYK
ncbi:response regulator [Flavobacterium sp.]|uniref:response regulator n=1 Tax=Flavobacterium sp. TaxID=239 RepID=UPI00260F9164|nr:response regulator [Flavobacterium sp.]MDG2432783.1 response regulator [Flavobacterium sp.]